MITERFEFAGCNKTLLPAVLWQPEGKIRALLQVTHGMTEHMGRYEQLAEALCSQGVAVAGFDLRGHGKNDGNPNVASCGEGGWAASIEDMRLFFELLGGRFPKCPHYMLGFSLGSFLLREYLTRYPAEGELSGAIIAGTGHQPRWILSVIMFVIKEQIAKVGFDQTNDLVRRFSFETYNKDFKPNRTAADWLCSDNAQLDRYLADPLVRKDISAGLFYELLGSMKRTAGSHEYDGWDTGLPILFLSGENDPVGNVGLAVHTISKRMKKSGMENVTVRLFEDARHDLFHEESSGVAEKVRQCICQWLLQTNPSGE